MVESENVAPVDAGLGGGRSSPADELRGSGPRAALAAGFDGYLEKPISVRSLPDQVRAHPKSEDTR